MRTLYTREECIRFWEDLKLETDIVLIFRSESGKKKHIIVRGSGSDQFAEYYLELTGDSLFRLNARGLLFEPIQRREFCGVHLLKSTSDSYYVFHGEEFQRDLFMDYMETKHGAELEAVEWFVSMIDWPSPVE